MSDERDDQAWVEGHRAGYQKGRDDGIGIGYTDAKLRAFVALDAVAENGRTFDVKVMREALEATLGKRP